MIYLQMISNFTEDEEDKIKRENASLEKNILQYFTILSYNSSENILRYLIKLFYNIYDSVHIDN